MIDLAAVSDQLRSAVAKLEIELLRHVREFQRETGFRVEGIAVHQIDISTGEKDAYATRLKVKVQL